MSYYKKNEKHYCYAEYYELGHAAHSSMNYRYLAFSTTWARRRWLVETNMDSWRVARKITRRQLEETIGAYIIVGANKWRYLEGVDAPYVVISRNEADRLGVPFEIYEYQSRLKNY